jgi:TonB family protein
MSTTRIATSWLLSLLVISLTASMNVGSVPASHPPATLEQLKAKLEKQYAAIEDLFKNGPAKKVFPPDPRERLRLWQADLAQAFAQAQATIEEILALHPAEEENWRERRDTMWLYAQPASPPASRSVFGGTEVQKRARLLDPPAAAYPDQARAAKAKGEVRLRLVLAGDGTVKNIFPMKPLKYGLTEAAIEAARQIKFKPAVRNGQPVSQFATLSYEFKNGRGLPPFFPDHEFYF